MSLAVPIMYQVAKLLLLFVLVDRNTVCEMKTVFKWESEVLGFGHEPGH